MVIEHNGKIISKDVIADLHTTEFFLRCAMKKLRTEYNKQAKSQGNLKATLCIMALVMMLVSACSGNSKTHSTSEQGQKDSVTWGVTPPSSETTDAQAPPIFEELAGNMVYVEGDSGSFYLCKYEVTQRLWREVMGDNPSEMQGDDLPVEDVNWNDCQTFIAKLNELTGKHFRLPTEAEWEYACRGGKNSKGYKYSGSDNLDEVAWYDENSDGKTHPVGQKQPNELGLYDMSGNVWEWCSDWYGSYSSSSQTNPTGLTSGSMRVLRGGGWSYDAGSCRVSCRGGIDAYFRDNCYGFRLALSQ